MPLVNTSNIVKDDTSDIIYTYDPQEYGALKNFINYNYNDAGNLTYYKFEFNSNFSDYVLNTMFKIGSSTPSETQLPCLNFKFIRGNFLRLIYRDHD